MRTRVRTCARGDRTGDDDEVKALDLWQTAAVLGLTVSGVLWLIVMGRLQFWEHCDQLLFSPREVGRLLREQPQASEATPPVSQRDAQRLFRTTRRQEHACSSTRRPMPQRVRSGGRQAGIRQEADRLITQTRRRNS